MTPTVPNMIKPVNKKPRLSPSNAHQPGKPLTNGSAGSIKKPSRPMQGTTSTDAVAGTKRKSDEENSMIPPATQTTDGRHTDAGVITTAKPATVSDPVKNKTLKSSLSRRIRPKPRQSTKTNPIRRPGKIGRSTLQDNNNSKKSSAISIGAARKRISVPGAPTSTPANETVGSKEDEEDPSVKLRVGIPNASKEPSDSEQSSAAKASTSEPTTELAAVTKDHHPYQHFGELDPAWNVPALKENEKTMRDFCSKFVLPKEDKDNDEADGGAVEANNPAAPVRGNVGVEEERGNIEGEEGNEANASGPLVEIINGEIVIKESSIVIGAQQTTEDVDKELAADGAVVEEDAYGITATYTSFTNNLKTQHWKMDETRQFYMALRQCGTDFSTMEQMYERFDKPKTRKQLKSKYKRECKKNPRLIDMAMNPSAQIPLDHSLFGDIEIEKTSSTTSTAKEDPTDSSTLEKEATPMNATSTSLLSVKSNTNENGPIVIDVDETKLTTETPQSIGSKQEPSELVKVLEQEDGNAPIKKTEGATGTTEKVESQLSSSVSDINNTQSVEPVVKKSEDPISDNVAKPIALFGVRKKSAQRTKFRAKPRPKKSKMKRPAKK